MAQPSTSTVRYGAGTLYIAPLGTTEPTTVSSALDAAWVKLGYTEAGSTFTSTPAVTQLDVAEEYRVIRNIITGITEHVAFSLAEATYANVFAAFNGGVATVNGVATTFEPPALGSEARVMLLWTSVDTISAGSAVPNEVWLYRQAFQTGAVAIQRSKTAKTLIPCDFTLEQPSLGVKPWKAFFAGSLATA